MMISLEPGMVIPVQVEKKTISLDGAQARTIYDDKVMIIVENLNEKSNKDTKQSIESYTKTVNQVKSESFRARIILKKENEPYSEGIN
jgi:aspartate 1-decarboxylase